MFTSSRNAFTKQLLRQARSFDPISRTYLYKPVCSSTSSMLTQFFYPIHTTPSQHFSWLPQTKSELLALDDDLAKQEIKIVDSVKDNAVKFFLHNRNKMLKREKNDDYPYPIFEPVLKRLIINLQLNFKNELNDKDHEINRLYQKGISLLEQEIPYKDTIRFVVRYLHTIDKFFLEKHPQLASSFHFNNAFPALDMILGHAPNILLFPTFKDVDISYFLKTRSAPFHIAGIDLGQKTPYADGFAMKPSEFFWHAIGHIEYMENFDFAYLSKTFKPLERVVHEWFFTSERINHYLKSLKNDKNLRDATELILFEILHERGFQYSLAVLKAQLDTSKWIDILNRKLLNHYYDHFPEMNMNLFPELENARKQLLDFVSKSRCEDQKLFINSLHSEVLPVRVTHHPKVNYGKGRFNGLLIDEKSTYALLKNDQEEIIKLQVSELILAQINPVRQSLFDQLTKSKIEYILKLKKVNTDISCIAVSLNNEIFVVLKDSKQIPLNQFSVKLDEKNIPNKNREYFEMEQVLGAHEQGKIISYTHQKPSQVYIGTLKLNQDQIEVLDEEDKNLITIPLAEALIDPLQKEDFAPAAVFRPR